MQCNQKDNISISSTKECICVVLRLSKLPAEKLKLLKQQILGNHVFLMANFEKYPLSIGQSIIMDTLVNELKVLQIQFQKNGNPITPEEIKNEILNLSISHDYKEEYEDIKKYLNSALNLVIDCEEPLFYSVPAQSVIKIGESFYKGKSKDHNISEYPLLIADTRSATNYFLVKEKGAEMTKITSSILGEGSLSQLGRLLLSSGDSSINGIVEKGIKEGNNLNCDLLVSDIYGESAKAINLPGEIIASCFGKPDYSFSSKEDIVKSLIIMHSLDISNITALLAQIHQVQTVLLLQPNLEGEVRGAGIESYLSSCLAFQWQKSQTDQILFLGTNDKSQSKIKGKYLVGIGMLI